MKKAAPTEKVEAAVKVLQMKFNKNIYHAAARMK